MSRPSDEDDRLALLLRAVPAPEPPPDFVARARIRYAQALEARCRREAFTALATSALGLVIAVAGLLSVFEPVAIIAWAGVVAAEVTTWMTGIAILLSIVPPEVWPSALVGLLLSLLPLVFLARARSLAGVK